VRPLLTINIHIKQMKDRKIEQYQDLQEGERAKEEGEGGLIW
jgi:hypothetical protein